MNKKTISSLLLGASIALAHSNVIASPLQDGSQLISPNSAAVADGNPSNKVRETYFKDAHKIIPKGREVGSYYASWGVHAGRDYAPHQVPVERLSHVYVGFGGICGDNPAAYNNGSGLKTACQNLLGGSDNGSYYLSRIQQLKDGEVNFIDDGWAYFDKKMTSPEGEYAGQLSGMIDWKNRNPDLKVIWSLGGWSYSRPFYAMANSAQGRKIFIDSIVKWLSEPVMFFVDGVDLDWEFPGGEGADAGVGNPMTDGKAYVALLKELRAALDQLGTKNNRHYELSAAIGVGPSKLSNFKASGSVIADMLPYLDRLGLMTYDFHGAWDNAVGFNASLGRNANDNNTLTIKEVIGILEQEHNITDFSKISLGLAFYGRSHGNVSAYDANSVLGSSASGAGQGGSIEAGSYSYFDLYKNFIGKEGKGINGWQVLYYPEYAAALLWNQSRQQVISYTPPKGVQSLVEYAKSKNMKGVFSWTVDDDNGLLLEAVHTTYQHVDTVISPRKPKLAYAPDCSNFNGTIKPGMLFRSSGTVFKANGWITKCPGQGAAWENAQWQNMSGQLTVLSHSEESQQPQDPANNIPQADNPFENQQPQLPENNYPQIPESNNPQTTPSFDNQQPQKPVNNNQSGGSSSQSGVSVWSSGQVYSTSGQVVSHNGKQYKNKWWTQGEEPGTSAVWELMGGSSNGVSVWSASKVYSKAGTVVTHNGTKYKNKWYANQGEEPGISSTWEALGDSGSNAWSATKTYDKAGTFVIHKGVQYRNKWYANPGEEPGISQVWEQQ